MGDSSPPIPEPSLLPRAGEIAHEVRAAPAGEVLARLYEDRDGIDTRSRWTIGESRRACARCALELSPAAEFHSVLVARRELDSSVFGPDCSEVFARVDYCAACFPSVPLEEVFAHWKGTVHDGEEPPRKIVHLSSLLAYFVRLAEIARAPQFDGRRSAAEAALGTDPRAAARELRYLLALYLVRKRVLRWREQDTAARILTLEERGAGEAPPEIHEVDLPAGTGEAYEQAVRVLEELLA